MKTLIPKLLLPLLVLFFGSCSPDEDPETLQQFEIAQNFLASNDLIPSKIC